MAKINRQTVTLLKQLLSSWTVFYQKAHTYHWDLTGENFLSLHKQFQSIYEDSVKHTDVIAERLRQIGERIDLSLASASSDSVVRDDNSANSPNAMTQDLITGIAQLTVLQTSIYNEADAQGDYVTADLMVQLSKWAEFNSWFLSAIIGTENTTNV